MLVIEASRKGRKQGNLGELYLEAHSEPCWLHLLGGSFTTSKEAIIKSFDISWTPKALGQTAPSAPPSRPP